jgi:DNA-damage-inducible protein J
MKTPGAPGLVSETWDSGEIKRIISSGLQCGSNRQENHPMSENAVVRARIDLHIKEEASSVLAAMGLTVSDAFRLLLTRIAREKKLPFEPLTPNETTIAAMREARAGNLKSFESVAALMADLHTED